MKLPPQPPSASTRERIILATITCIERTGLDAVTVRAIAAEADVNGAAVNYHFGSKHALMKEVLEHTLRNGFALDELDELLAQGMPVRDAVVAFVVQYLHDAVRYPRLAQAHLHDGFVHGRWPKRTLRAFGGFIEGFLERADRVLVGRTVEERRRSVVQLWSAILLVVVLPGFFTETGVRFDSVEARERYARSLLDRHLLAAPRSRD